MRFAIYGVGGFGREVAPLARTYLEQEASGGEVVFVDDADDRPTACNGLRVIGFDQLTPQDRIVIAIGDGRTREAIDRRCREAGLTVAGVSAPTVRNLDHNEIAPDAVLCDHVTITANARIGRGFQANIYSYVAHDCVIGDFVTFAPRVHCNGAVQIGDYAYIGTAAIFVQGTDRRPLTVGEGAIVGMGSVVTKSVEPYTVVAGNPARAIRKIR
jgi:sugar O-acyltransferase (sialic acid O-acetyltransferase NeuD family)